MTGSGEFTFDGTAVPFNTGDHLLTALVRVGIHPTGGGTLCAEGHSPHCVAEVDGSAYVHTCQTLAREGMIVRAHPTGAPPVLPSIAPPERPVAVRNIHHEVIVIGGGESGRAAAAAAGAPIVDAKDGREAIGIYPGPMVAVRTDDGMVHAHVNRIVVATGALPLLPVCPGNDLAGLYTPVAAERLTAAGVDLGQTVRITGPPDRFEGDIRVRSVVVGGERIECDAVIVDIGTTPNDVLARMGAGLAIDTVGDAATATSPPPCPVEGTVCPCNETTMAELAEAWARGFTSMELLKRASLAGTGVCQGAVCSPYLQSFIADRTGSVEAPFTARPVARQATLSEIAAGRHHPAVPRTSLHAIHEAAGATMDRLGGWWRPWMYSDVGAEYDAVRNAVSLGDVGTLGKFIVSGPDAEAALQRLISTDVSTIRPGRSRYVLMLDERGYVLDDGMILREPEGDRFFVTVTSGGASVAEMWFRDWTAHLDVRWMNVTMALGAINVTGPRAPELLARVGFDEPLPMLQHTESDIADVPCRVVRLSFTGEVSFELHHPFARSGELWHALLDAGSDLGVVPHGLDALSRLRLEKGHIIVGQDSDYDSTPRRLHHDWMVNLDSGNFIGRHAVERTNRLALDKQLVGLESEGPAPFEGAVAWTPDGEYAGYVTSAAWSPTLDRSVMLAWIRLADGELPQEVWIEGESARRVALPFYDPAGTRARG